tara:strand:- start:24 stop:422 length:399 start_codon:yes stop_codon:yes gene_type:complete
MSEEFKIEIINPERSFFSEDKVLEVVVPAFEGEMGILKDHIPVISFMKPGIIKIKKLGESSYFYVEDGIVEFKDNFLSILTSYIFEVNQMDRSMVEENLRDAEKQLQNPDLSDQHRFLIDQKIEVLKNINLN